MKQVVAGICGKAEFRKQQEHRLPLDRLFNQGYRARHVEVGIGDTDARDPNCNAHEVMIIEIEELITGAHDAYSKELQPRSYGRRTLLRPIMSTSSPST